MKGIQAILTDIDGIFGDFKKLVVDEDLSPHYSDFKRINQAYAPFKESGVRISAITGHSYARAKEIIPLCGLDSICGFEMCALLYDPESDKTYSLVDVAYPHLRPVVDELKRARDKLAQAIDEFQEKLGASIIFLSDRTEMITFETNGRKRGYDLEPILRDYISKVAPLMQGYERCKKIEIISSPIAVDIQLKAANKGCAAQYILDNVYKLPIVDELGHRPALCKVDSAHSDILMMELCEFLGCPDNADDGTKEYVKSHAKKGTGYISKKSNVDGTLDILDYAKENWL